MCGASWTAGTWAGVLDLELPPNVKCNNPPHYHFITGCFQKVINQFKSNITIVLILRNNQIQLYFFFLKFVAADCPSTWVGRESISRFLRLVPCRPTCVSPGTPAREQQMSSWMERKAWPNFTGRVTPSDKEAKLSWDKIQTVTWTTLTPSRAMLVKSMTLICGTRYSQTAPSKPCTLGREFLEGMF